MLANRYLTPIRARTKRTTDRTQHRMRRIMEHVGSGSGSGSSSGSSSASSSGSGFCSCSGSAPSYASTSYFNWAYAMLRLCVVGLCACTWALLSTFVHRHSLTAENDTDETATLEEGASVGGRGARCRRSAGGFAQCSGSRGRSGRDLSAASERAVCGLRSARRGTALKLSHVMEISLAGWRAPSGGRGARCRRSAGGFAPRGGGGAGAAETRARHRSEQCVGCARRDAGRRSSCPT